MVLDKKSRGKNGLEDDLDISLCLGNAKIKYRYVSGGRNTKNGGLLMGAAGCCTLQTGRMRVHGVGWAGASSPQHRLLDKH